LLEFAQHSHRTDDVWIASDFHNFFVGWISGDPLLIVDHQMVTVETQRDVAWLGPLVAGDCASGVDRFAAVGAASLGGAIGVIHVFDP
jgi:hypothetical protein